MGEYSYVLFLGGEIMKEIDILEYLVSFNTIQDKENKQITKYIEKLLKDCGFEVERIKDERNHDCLVANIGENPIIGFMGHLDTVTTNDKWLTDPFTLTEEKSKLIGLGSCDMKGGIAAILSVVGQMDLSKLKKGLELIFTTSEETDFLGIETIVKKDIKLPPYMIVMEPTNEVPVTATKGAMCYEITFNGKSAHGSNHNLGINAIMLAINFINELQLFIKELDNTKNSLFDIDHTTFNLGTIKGGTMVNVIPDQCLINIEFRTINNEHNNIINNELLRLGSIYNAKIKNLFTIGVMENNDHDFISLIENLTQKAKGVSYLTEASYLKDSKAIILGPGPVTAHEANEYITKESYKTTIDVYKKIIEKMCF
jgi:acetylornithine deacetylase